MNCDSCPEVRQKWRWEEQNSKSWTTSQPAKKRIDKKVQPPASYILFWALVVIFNHLGGVGTIFRFLKSESFSKRSYTPKSVAFGRIRGFSKRLIFLNSDLDTQNDLKPTIIQYNICCTYKKRLDYVVRSEKKWKGGSGGSGEGKNRSKKGSFDPKTAENRAPGGLTTPQTSQK